MITKLKIQNFKSHKDTDINLGNLTVLTGINSAGKSSVIQSLLLLRQSFLKTTIMSGLELEGTLCKIGNGNDALYKFSDTSTMTFQIEANGESFHFEYDVKKYLNSSFISQSGYGDNITQEKLEQISLFNTNFQYISSQRVSNTSHFDRYDFEVETQKQISKELGQGECVGHFLYAKGGDKSFNYLFDGEQYALVDQVELWERRISPNITINVEKSNIKGFDIKYGYKFPAQKPIGELRAENIGFGISHSLPVITALLSAEPGALILLENPETHLHPKGQAELAKLIARVAQHGVQVIVETHSDHIINGILVAAKQFEDGDELEKGLDRNNVRIFLFDKEKENQSFTNIQEIKIEEHGRLDFQPEGFFDQAEQDLFYLAGF